MAQISSIFCVAIHFYPSLLFSDEEVVNLFPSSQSHYLFGPYAPSIIPTFSSLTPSPTPSVYLKTFTTLPHRHFRKKNSWLYILLRLSILTLIFLIQENKHLLPYSRYQTFWSQEQPKVTKFYLLSFQKLFHIVFL